MGLGFSVWLVFGGCLVGLGFSVLSFCTIQDKCACRTICFPSAVVLGFGLAVLGIPSMIAADFDSGCLNNNKKENNIFLKKTVK